MEELSAAPPRSRRRPQYAGPADRPALAAGAPLRRSARSCDVAGRGRRLSGAFRSVAQRLRKGYTKVSLHSSASVGLQLASVEVRQNGNPKTEKFKNGEIQKQRNSKTEKPKNGENQKRRNSKTEKPKNGETQNGKTVLRYAFAEK